MYPTSAHRFNILDIDNLTTPNFENNVYFTKLYVFCRTFDLLYNVAPIRGLMCVTQRSINDYQQFVKRFLRFLLLTQIV